MTTQANFKSTRLPMTENIGLAPERAMAGAPRHLPQGAVLVSSDNHWGLAEDIWRENAPAHLRDRMPRCWFDEELQLWNVGFNGKGIFGGAFADVFRSAEGRPGARSIPERMADLDANGVAMEIVFPQSPLVFWGVQDLEVRDWIFRIYNEHLAEVGRRAPGRFFGVGVANHWNPAKMRESVEHIVNLGLKTYMLPITPGRHPDGRLIAYGDPELEPLWSAAEEAGLPVCFHIGENILFEGAGAVATGAIVNLSPLRKNLSELIFGGLFDRHPNLRIVFAEAGINWVAAALQDAEMVYDSFEPLLEPKIRKRPSEYWHNNCYATFMSDQIGLDLIGYIGVDRVMWSTDYPHNESSFSYSTQVINDILFRFSEDDAKKILGGTAMKVFNLA